MSALLHKSLSDRKEKFPKDWNITTNVQGIIKHLMEEWLYRERRLLDLLQLLLKKLIFYRSVSAQVSGTEHGASEVVSTALALPLEWSSRNFAASESSRAKILSSDLPQRNAQGGLLDEGCTHLHPSCELHIKHTHKYQQQQGFQEPELSKLVQGKRLPNLPSRKAPKPALSFVL